MKRKVVPTEAANDPILVARASATIPTSRTTVPKTHKPPPKVVKIIQQLEMKRENTIAVATTATASSHGVSKHEQGYIKQHKDDAAGGQRRANLDKKTGHVDGESIDNGEQIG